MKPVIKQAWTPTDRDWLLQRGKHAAGRPPINTKRHAQCKFCWAWFKIRHFPTPKNPHGQVFCSRKCYLDSARVKDRPCQQCGKPYHSQSPRYCSDRCEKSSRIKPRPTFVCEHCKHLFIIFPPHTRKSPRFCGRRCQNFFSRAKVLAWMEEREKATAEGREFNIPIPKISWVRL